MSKADRTVLLNSLFVFGVVILFIGIIVWIFSGETPEQAPPETDTDPTPSEDDLIAFEPFDFDVSRLQAEWQQERDAFGDLPIGPDEEAVLEELYRVNERSTPDVLQGELAALNQEIVERVTPYIAAHGPRTYRALGWQAIEGFHRAVDEVLARSHQSSTAPWTLLDGDSAEARQWRRQLGNFFDMARRRGLVDPSGRLTVDPALLTALFRFRWLGFARDYANMSLMTPYERMVIWRWRIEAAQDVPTALRLSMLDEVDSIYGDRLDADAARGIIYYQAGNLEEAHRYFRRAHRHHPDDERYQRYLEIVEARLPD